MHNEPLDEVVYCEVMFDDGVSGEVPEHRDFIYSRAIPFLERNGIKVVLLRSGMTFLESFYRVLKKGRSAGKINSWPLCGKCCIQRDCKLPPINAYVRSLGGGVVQYVGIAHDEQERLMRLESGKSISLLAKYKMTEWDAADICRRAGLYSRPMRLRSETGAFSAPMPGTGNFGTSMTTTRTSGRAFWRASVRPTRRRNCSTATSGLTRSTGGFALRMPNSPCSAAGRPARPHDEWRNDLSEMEKSCGNCAFSLLSQGRDAGALQQSRLQRDNLHP